MSDTFDGFDVDVAEAAARGQQQDPARPTFYTEAVQNNFKSTREGRPIFDEIEMVRVLIPGDRRNQPVYEVNDAHRKRWPREYKAFKEGREAPVDGTPLTQWPPIGVARAAEFALAGIKTVEQLAAVGDNVLQALGMGARELRTQAQTFLEVARTGAAPIARLVAENEKLKADGESKDQQIADLAARLEVLEKSMTGASRAA